MRLLLPAAVCAICLSAPAVAQPPAPPQKELAAAFRSLLLANLPDPLVKTESHWGDQVDGVFVKKKRNHGAWRRLRVTAFNPNDLLTVEVQKLASPEANRHTFEMIIDFAVAIDFQQQVWERGIRFWNGSTKARAKVKAVLKCEVATRTENGQGPLPDVVFRLRVTKADLTYRDLDVIHLGKFGGDFAEVMGKALHGCIREFRPDLERDLLKKANAAIVKAGDSKEVRVSLSKLLKLD